MSFHRSQIQDGSRPGMNGEGTTCQWITGFRPARSVQRSAFSTMSNLESFDEPTPDLEQSYNIRTPLRIYRKQGRMVGRTCNMHASQFSLPY
jgi:hypothetical protein